MSTLASYVTPLPNGGVSPVNDDDLPADADTETLPEYVNVVETVDGDYLLMKDGEPRYRGQVDDSVDDPYTTFDDIGNALQYGTEL